MNILYLKTNVKKMPHNCCKDFEICVIIMTIIGESMEEKENDQALITPTEAGVSAPAEQDMQGISEAKTPKAKKTSSAEPKTAKASKSTKSASKKVPTKKPAQKKEKSDPAPVETRPYYKGKITLDNYLAGVMFAYKNNMQKNKKFSMWALIIGYIGLAIVFALDITDKAGWSTLIYDFALLGLLIGVTVFILLMPKIVANGQKKLFKSMHFDEMDYEEIIFDADKIYDTSYKNGEIMAKNVCLVKDITLLGEDETRFFVCFGKSVVMILEKDKLHNIAPDEFKTNMIIQIEMNKKSHV